MSACKEACGGARDDLLNCFWLLKKFRMNSLSVKMSWKMVSTSQLYSSLMMVLPRCSEHPHDTSPGHYRRSIILYFEGKFSMFRLNFYALIFTSVTVIGAFHTHASKLHNVPQNWPVSSKRDTVSYSELAMLSPPTEITSALGREESSPVAPSKKTHKTLNW